MSEKDTKSQLGDSAAVVDVNIGMDDDVKNHEVMTMDDHYTVEDVDLGQEIHPSLPEDRDPHRWHEFVKVKFDDIFGEVDTEVYSYDNVWRLANNTYSQTKIWCYRVTSLILVIPCAAFWGVYFACLSFSRVWCCVPCLKSCDIELHCIRRLIEITLRTFVAPCFEAVGRCFYHLRIRVLKAEDYNS